MGRARQGRLPGGSSILKEVQEFASLSLCSSNHDIFAFFFSLQPRLSPPYSRASPLCGVGPTKGSRSRGQTWNRASPLGDS